MAKQIIINGKTYFVVPVTRAGGALHYALGVKRGGRQAGFDWVISPRPSQQFGDELNKLRRA